MDHILQLRVEHQSSSAKHCNRGIARFTRSADASLVTLALAAIAFLALFLSSSPFSVASSPSSTLSARLVAVVGSIFTSKTALFVLSNVIFALLAADYRCHIATTASASLPCHAASSGEPGGVLEKQAQAQHHQVQVQVQVEQCAVAVQSCVPCSANLDHGEQEGEEEDMSTMSANTLPDEEQLPKLELVRLGEEDSSITLKETVDDVEEPTCETAQGLDRLEISELNKKFDEFIRSRRIKWVKEEAYLLLCEV